MLDNLTINDLPDGVVDVVEEVIYIYLMNQVLLKGLETE